MQTTQYFKVYHVLLSVNGEPDAYVWYKTFVIYQ